MSANQKRMLTAPTSKLTKVNLVSVLRRDDAWILLSKETREQLYAMLPAPAEDETPHDPDIHPLNTRYKVYIETAIRRFGEDLAEGREQKKWRTEALQASKDRADGKFDEWKEVMRDEYWGKAEEENVEPVNGGARLNGSGESTHEAVLEITRGEKEQHGKGEA